MAAWQFEIEFLHYAVVWMIVHGMVRLVEYHESNVCPEMNVTMSECI